MIVLDPRTYPELTARCGLRDRPHYAELLDGGLWKIVWRSGRVSVYDDDPRGHLSLGYDPKPRGSHATAASAES
jgi:hypothetical protein